MNKIKSTVAVPFTAYQKWVIALLALLQFTVILDFMVLSPLGDMLMKSLGMTPSGFGSVVSAYAFSAGISGFLAAGFADKFDRKKILVFFYTGFIVGTICCALANTFWLLLCARIVSGLFGGVIGAVSMAIITDLFDVHHRGRVMGIVQMGLAASQILGLPAGLFFASLWDWHAPFIMVVVLAVAIIAVIIYKLKPIDKHLHVQSDKSPLLHLWHTLAKKRYQTGFLATAFLATGGFMLMPFGSAFLINNIGIATNELSWVYLASGVASIIVMPVVGKLSDRFNKFGIFTFGSLLSVVMILIYTNLGRVPLWEVMLVNVIMLSGIMSRMIPATALGTSVPELRDRGAYMSINGSLQQIAGGIASILAGQIVYQPFKGAPLQHYDRLGMVVSAVVIVCLFLVYRVAVMVKDKTHEMPAVAVLPE